MIVALGERWIAVPEGTRVIAALGFDGSREVVWGLGTSVDGAARSAARWLNGNPVATPLHYAEVDDALRARIAGG